MTDNNQMPYEEYYKKQLEEERKSIRDRITKDIKNKNSK